MVKGSDAIDYFAKMGELDLSVTFTQTYGQRLPEFVRVSSINNGYGIDFSYYSGGDTHLYLRFEARYTGQKNIQDLEFYNHIMKFNFLFCAHMKGDAAKIGPKQSGSSHAAFEWFKATTGCQDQDQFNQYWQWLEEMHNRFQGKCSPNDLGPIIIDFLKPRVILE